MTIQQNTGNRKKKIVVRQKPDPYLRKEWHTVKAPVMFRNNEIGQTPVLKTAGLRVASEQIKGRRYECNLGDLAENEEANGNLKFIFKATHGIKEQNESHLDFNGFEITRHKYQSLFRKRCSKIAVTTDVTTKDNYHLRIFAIAFTDRKQNSHDLNCYAKHSQVKEIRRIMSNKIQQELQAGNIKDIMTKLGQQTVNEKMNKDAGKVMTLRDVNIVRVKVVKTPGDYEEVEKKLYSGSVVDFGKKVEKK